MYKIITHTSETYLTEKPNFIRKHENGCFVLTDVNHAEGVAYHGTPYLFSDGAQVHEVDGGELTQESVELLNTLLTGEG